MAKKNLINADMLLASPRKVESVAPSPPPSVSQVEIQPEPISKDIAPVINTQPEEIPVPATTAESTPVTKTSVQKGLKEGETRATFIVQEAALDKIKAIAYWDRKNIKDVLNDALIAFINDYEKKNGAIHKMP